MYHANYWHSNYWHSNYWYENSEVVQSATTALTLAELQAAIAVDVSVTQGATTALTLTGYQATVALGIDVSQSATTALTLTENAATIVYDVDVIQGSTTALTLTGNQATVSADRTISQIATTALSLTEYSATLTYDVDVIQSATTALTITGYQATVGLDTNVIQGATTALTLTEYAATLVLDVTITQGAATALTISEYSASIQTGQNGGYWGATYWHNGYWHYDYWAEAPAETTGINQTSTPTMTMTAQVADVVFSVDVFATTPTMTMTGQAADAANDVTISATCPTMTLTGIGTTADVGEYYVGSVNFSVVMSSDVGWTEAVNATAPTMTLSALKANIEIADAIIVAVTSTPSMTMTAFPAIARNTVSVKPLTPSMAMTSYGVVTGFGTVFNTSSPSMTLVERQPSVEGVSNNVNEVSATLDSMTMTANVVVVDFQEKQLGGHSGGDEEAKKRIKRKLEGVKLRQQKFKEETVEEGLEALVSEVIAEAEQLEAQLEGDGSRIPGQDIADLVKQKAIVRQDIVRNLRKTEKLSQKAALIQMERRINEMVRQRREFFIIESDEIDSILFILSEVI